MSLSLSVRMLKKYLFILYVFYRHYFYLHVLCEPLCLCDFVAEFKNHSTLTFGSYKLFFARFSGCFNICSRFFRFYFWLFNWCFCF